MMKRYMILCVLAVLLAACAKEDTLTPLGAEHNWLVVEDSDDPIDHQRYLIYKETGIPVFYNDTLGSRERLSPTGEYYTYYERLQVYYKPGVQTPLDSFSLVQDRNSLKPVLNYLQTELLPMIPKTFYVPSLLLVNTLTSPSDTVAHRGLNTVACAKAGNFGSMNATEKARWKGKVLRSMVYSGLMEKEGEWLDENFYALTYAVNPGETRMYSDNPAKKGYVYQALGTLKPLLPAEQQTLGACGFLNINWKPATPTQLERMARIPTKSEDVSEFCEAVFAMTEEEFTERWGMYPVVIAKYHALKEKLKEYGFQ